MKTSKTPSLSWQNKLISTALAAVSLFLGAPQLALATVPSTASTNMTPISGGVTAVATGTSQLVVTATGTNSVVQWQSFSDGTAAGGLLSPTDAVTFSLPNSSSAILNNIVGSGVSVLNGSINSNGKVFFLNPNGILVANGAIINAASFYASTVSDSVANFYFANNGTLSVFNGGTPSSVGGSGIIYVQSGATVNVGTPGVAGNFALASAGSTAITITGNINATNSFSGASWTINTSNSAPNAAVSGVAVDSLSVGGGNTSVTTYGGTILLGNSNLGTALSTPNSGIYYGITPTGGNVNVYSNGGSITTNGNILSGGNLVLNTVNSYTGGAYGTNGAVTANGNVVSYGNLTVLTNGGNITLNNNSATTPAANSVTNGVTTLNAGLAGNVQIYGDYSNITTANGNNVIISLSSTGSRTIGNVISAGDVTINSNGNLTISKITDAGNLNAVSNTGTITVGSSSASTVGSTGSIGGQSNVSGYNGATITNTTFVNRGVSVSTSNTDSAGVSGAITLTSVSVNGATSIVANSGAITLTGVTETGNNGGSGAGNHSFTVSTGNGSISLSSVTTNGVTSFTTQSAGNYLTTGSGANAITGVTLVNNTPNNLWGSTSFTTNNGSITVTGLTTVNSKVTAQTSPAVIGTSSATTISAYGDITLTGLAANATSINGSLSLTTGNGNVTVTGITMVSSNVSNKLVNPVILTANTVNNNIQYNGGLSDVYITVNTVNQGLATYNTAAGISSVQASPNYGNFNLGTAGVTTTGNLAKTSVVVSSTGNVWVSNNQLATYITLASTSGTLYTANIDTTLGNGLPSGSISSLPSSTVISSISLTTNGDIGVNTTSVTSGIGSLSPSTGGGLVGAAQGPSNGISLTSVSGNVIATNFVNTNVTVATTNKATLTSPYTATATNGNIYILGTLTTNGLTLSAPLGSVTENTNTAILSNSAANTVGGTAGGAASASITGNVINLPSANILTTGSNGLLTLTSANNGGVVINSASATSTPTVLTKLNVTGNLTITASGPVTLGTTSTGESLKVTGITTINTASATSASSAINVGVANMTVAASKVAFTGNLYLTTNANAVTVGSSNIGGSFGTISVSSVNTTVPLNVTAPGAVAIYSTPTVDLGAIYATTLAVTSNKDITNTIGVVSESGISSFSTGTTTPGSLTLGTASPASLLGATTITQAANATLTGTATNLIGNLNTFTALNLNPSGGNITYSQTNGTITTLTNTGTTSGLIATLTGVNLTTLNSTETTGVTTVTSTTAGSIGSINATSTTGPISLTMGAAATLVTPNATTSLVNLNSTGGNITLVAYGAPISSINTVTTSTGTVGITTTNGSIGYVNASTVDGNVTFTTTNTLQSTATGSFASIGVGGLKIDASGYNTDLKSSSLGVYTYNLGNSTQSDSKIVNNGSFTISNLVSSANSTGSITVSANAWSTTSMTTAASGTGALTLGTGISLSGNEGATFTSGNATLGSVTDTASSNIFMYSGAANIIGRTITLAQSGSADNLPYVSFTSNGSVKYTEAGSVQLNGLTLGSAATSATITSTTGNIVQGGSGIISTGNSVSLTFQAGGTNGGVVLNNASNAIGQVTVSLPGTNSGTSGTNSGTITILATGNTTLTNSSSGGDINLGQVTIQNGGNGGTLTITNAGGNISQGTQSVWTYGDVSLTTTSATSGKNDILFSNAGNNFGKLTVSSTGNAAISETGTSVYTQVTTTKNFSASSAQSDISLATTNSAFRIDTGSVVGGYANFSAITGNVLIAQTGATFGGANVSLISAGNASISTSDSALYINSNTKVGGNLTVTNTNTNGTVYDIQSTTSGVTIGGIFSVTSKNLTFSNSLDTVGGLFTTSTGTASISVAGNLVLVAGSKATNAYFTASGNITNTNAPGLDASVFSTMTLATSIGNVTIGGPTSVTGLFTVYAPLGTVNLSGLSKSVDLNSTAPTVTAATYIPPKN